MRSQHRRPLRLVRDSWLRLLPGHYFWVQVKIANIIFGMAGIAQIAAAFIPAAHVRTRGSIPFFRLPNAGMAFLVLGVLTALLAFTRLGWWRAIVPLASIVLTAVVYMRVRLEPSGGFADPLLRHLVRPAWGFVPMFAAGVLGLIVSILAGLVRRESEAAKRAAIDTN